MRFRTFAVLPVIGALAAGHANATTTLNFTLGGDGNVTASGTLSLGPDPYAGAVFGTPANLTMPVSPPDPAPYFQGLADPLNALAITGATGTFLDKALGITDATITGLAAIQPQPHYDPDDTIPHSFGWYPGIPATTISYDNLFYLNGSPLTCSYPPPGNYGGYFDNYGVMFMLSNGDVVDLYSNGWIAGPGNPDAAEHRLLWGRRRLHRSHKWLYRRLHQRRWPDVHRPEPSTWAMMIFGFAGLGFVGYRASRKAALSPRKGTIW